MNDKSINKNKRKTNKYETPDKETKSNSSFKEDVESPNISGKDDEEIKADAYEEASFFELDYIDRNRLDISKIAKRICDEDMGPRKEKEYLTSIWNAEDGLVRIYFNKFTYFINQVRTEIDKITGVIETDQLNPHIDFPEKDIKHMTLWEIRKYFPEKEKEIRNSVFNGNRLDNGNYHCMNCGKESDKRYPYHIDHIKPMSRGGLTELENLQILCRTCNMRKSDKYYG